MQTIRRRLVSMTASGLLAALLVGLPTRTSAEYFSLYLKCEGAVTAGKKKTKTHLDLALRDNNETALIQRSNVLPVGEKMRYEVSPATYSMRYHAPGVGSRVYYDWYRGYLFDWNPYLKRLAVIRLSIDRQTGRLDGEILNNVDEVLARIGMECEAVSQDELPEPKF
jgi:hypothetical protein